MVRNGQKHRHRIVVIKKTSASHRFQKLTIAEVYAGPKESIDDNKPRLFPRDFSLFASVIIFFILNVRSWQYHTQVMVYWWNGVMEWCLWFLAAWWCTRGWNKGRIVTMDNNSGSIWLFTQIQSNSMSMSPKTSHQSPEKVTTHPGLTHQHHHHHHGQAAAIGGVC